MPVPGELRKFNDFVLHTYSNYIQLYQKDTVVIIKPVAYTLNIPEILNKTTLYYKLKHSFTGYINNFRVFLLPYISAWRRRNLHAFATATIYCLNIRKLKSLLLDYNFDVIHAQFILPDGLLAYKLSRKSGIPYIITPHNESFYFEHCLSRHIALKILRNASLVTTLNNSSSLYFKSLNLRNVILMPHGFSKNFVRIQKKPDPRQTRILTVAALIKLKNVDKVLFAVKELSSRYNIHYTIIGNGPEKENLITLADQLQINDYVNFIDSVPHDLMADEMYKYDIFIMPSYFETFGRVYFEAMAMGIPIICAIDSGIYGIFKDMEEGISVNHKSVENIKDALEYLIKSPEERLRIGKNGKKLVEKYTWENIAIELHKKYLEAAETK